MNSSVALETFETYREPLLGLAYRITGSRVEAEDIVQEACLKWLDVDHAAIQVPRAWLMKVTTRLALDYLKSARVQRMSYIGPWLPEPYLVDQSTPEDELELDESISMALLVLLDQLSPAERASFILHDLFQYRFDEIGEILERSESSCRKLASRARGKLGRKPWKTEQSRDDHLQILTAFSDAVKRGETEELVLLLKTDATFISDGGGKATASRKVLEGADVIARFFLKLVHPHFVDADANRLTIEVSWFNGAPGLIVREAGAPITAFHFELDAGNISGIYALRNPDKLRLFGVREQGKSGF